MSFLAILIADRGGDFRPYPRIVIVNCNLKKLMTV